MNTRIVTAYAQLMEKYESGESIYRSKRDRQNTRMRKDQTDWFRQRGYQVTASVPLTVNSELTRILMKEADKL